MSEQATEATAGETSSEPEGTEGAEGKEAVELPPQDDAAFGALMDALAPEEGGDEGGTGDAPAASSGDSSGAPASEGEAKPEDGGSAAADADGDAGKPAVEGEGGDVSGDASAATGGEADPGAEGRPAEWTADAAELTPKFGELSTQLEETVAKAYHEEALDEIREEHARYFEELEKHPREMIGQEVPRVNGEGMQTLRDSEDAKEWQEAVKKILVEEVRDRASRSLEENSEFLETVHSSIELFQNNPDLVPGTKQFDVELANKFTTMMKDYEIRDDEEKKLFGYSVPVQPIINSLRTDLAAARAAAKTPPPAKQDASTGASQKQEEAPPKKEDEPQAGIQSKAGNSSEEEDFSTLFGTIGLPNLRI